MSSAKARLPIYQLKITLIGIKLPIWREIQVPSSINLCCLHSALQVAMGWTDSHLHQFEKDGKYWGEPQFYEDEDLDVIDDGGVTIGEVVHVEGDLIVYQYDFGDNWLHDVVLENILPADGDQTRPVCIAGERRCPPEDVGGISGYEEFLEVIFDPKHEDYEHYVGWAGGHFVDEFDVNAVDKKLSGMRWPVKHSR